MRFLFTGPQTPHPPTQAGYFYTPGMTRDRENPSSTALHQGSCCSYLRSTCAPGNQNQVIKKEERTNQNPQLGACTSHSPRPAWKTPLHLHPPPGYKADLIFPTKKLKDRIFQTKSVTCRRCLTAIICIVKSSPSAIINPTLQPPSAVSIGVTIALVPTTGPAFTAATVTAAATART